MKWTVSNFPRHRLYRQTGELAGCIRRRKSGYVGYDPQGAQLVRVAREGDGRLCAVVGGQAIQAHLHLLEAGPRRSLRPPRADCVTFCWRGHPVCLSQTDCRDFVAEKSAVGGAVTGMLGWRATVEADPEEAGFAALLYIFADLMLHEDDLELV